MSSTRDGQDADEPTAAKQTDPAQADSVKTGATQAGREKTDAARTAAAQADPETAPEPAAEPAPRVRRRRPEQTRDDTDLGWGDRPDEDAHERWLREQRPPHWE